VIEGRTIRESAQAQDNDGDGDDRGRRSRPVRQTREQATSTASV
jgi:hypothetical protein